jgi:DNA repair protein RecO (recombination protein O)
MLVKTRGVVLRFIKYQESSIIVNIYTEALGLQSYIVNGIRSSRSKKNKIALYQPLTLLDLVVYFREEKQLHRLTEAKCRHPFYSIPLNPKKSAIVLFLVEVLGKSLKEQIENKELFSFIWNALRRLDSEKKYPENFHLVFIVKLAKYLGFAPQNSYEIYAELKNEMDTDLTDESILVDKLLTCDFETTPTMSVRQRIKILKVLLSLYQLHIEHFGNIKSLKVLNQVFR